jgi:hypothetical protein
MKASQTYRIALIAIAGFLLAATFHTGPAAQGAPLKGLETLSLFMVRGPMVQVGPK